MKSNDNLDQLAAEVGAKLKEHGWLLATAESCTGGGIGEAITRIAGSSHWFDRGFITYSNHAKQEMLGVSPQTILQFGAVSEETVREMVRGAIEHSRANIAVAVSGVAGPDGGSPQKPVGTICIAWMSRDSAPLAKTFHFDGARNEVRRQAIVAALTKLLDLD
ncbi:MAG: CinA family protein [Burkholderiales bacterium]